MDPDNRLALLNETELEEGKFLAVTAGRGRHSATV